MTDHQHTSRIVNTTRDNPRDLKDLQITHVDLCPSQKRNGNRDSANILERCQLIDTWAPSGLDWMP